MFHFKQFSVSHHRSAMKIGVDGVLIGCWASVTGANRILDVGTGCGVIALMMAQRCPGAEVVGIDIDIPSVEEALENAKASPWRERVQIRRESFDSNFIDNYDRTKRFDLVVSNPPYFNSGVSVATTAREKARHQGVLSPGSILILSREILNEGGSVAMVIPFDESELIEKEAAELGYTLTRKCVVRGHEKAPWKRTLLQWQFGNERLENTAICKYLTLETSPGIPTEGYRELCKDFYLKF